MDYSCNLKDETKAKLLPIYDEKELYGMVHRFVGRK
jgi:hypothetical protein